MDLGKKNNFKNVLIKNQPDYIFHLAAQAIVSKAYREPKDTFLTNSIGTLNILESLNKVHWLIGGIPKSGDNFFMSKKKCINFKAYIYGKKNIFPRKTNIFLV